MKAITRFAITLCYLCLSACTTLVTSPELATLPTGEAAIMAYQRVLQTYVNDRGEVNFPALQAKPSDLERYIAFVAQQNADLINNPNERLAHYINSYNALSMYNVIRSGIPKTHAGSALIEFFYLRKHLIGGKQLSLYDYENDVIRKLKEPRVHFALNCSALSCPVLPRAVFTGDGLDEELNRETRKFFAETRNLQIDRGYKTVYVSELLDFYKEDFLSAATPTLIAYINQYAPEKIPDDFNLEFIPYDWTIANSAR